jgi:hypothetical protein
MRNPSAGRSTCITVSLALASTAGSSDCNWLSRCPRAAAVCVPLRMMPRLVFSPRWMASSSDRPMGCAETSPVATLPWNGFVLCAANQCRSTHCEAFLFENVRC